MATKYQATYEGADGASWQTHIDAESHAGAATAIEGSGRGHIEAEWSSGAEDLISPVMTSRQRLAVLDEGSAIESDLVSIGTGLELAIHRDGTERVRGRIAPGDFGYDPERQLSVSTFEAEGPLGALGAAPFAPGPDGVRLAVSGRPYHALSVLLSYCLSKTETGFGMEISMNWYPYRAGGSQFSAITQPLDVVVVNGFELAKSIGDNASCLAVLQQILLAFGCRIHQAEQVWHIEQMEYKDEGSQRVFVYPAGWWSSGNLPSSSLQSRHQALPAVHEFSAERVRRRPAFRTVSVRHDVEVAGDQFIQNGSFETYDGSTFAFWTPVGSGGQWNSNDNASDGERALNARCFTTPDVLTDYDDLFALAEDNYLRQTLPEWFVSSGDRFVLLMDVNGNRQETHFFFRFEIGGYYLGGDGTWSTDVQYIAATHQSGYGTIAIRTEALPATGKLQPVLDIHQPVIVDQTNSLNTGLVDNIRFEYEAGGVPQAEGGVLQGSLDNDSYLSGPLLELKLGDGPTANAPLALRLAVGGSVDTLTSYWRRGVWGSSTPTASSYSLHKLVIDSVLNLYAARPEHWPVTLRFPSSISPVLPYHTLTHDGRAYAIVRQAEMPGMGDQELMLIELSRQSLTPSFAFTEPEGSQTTAGTISTASGGAVLSDTSEAAVRASQGHLAVTSGLLAAGSQTSIGITAIGGSEHDIYALAGQDIQLVSAQSGQIWTLALTAPITGSSTSVAFTAKTFAVNVPLGSYIHLPDYTSVRLSRTHRMVEIADGGTLSALSAGLVNEVAIVRFAGTGTLAHGSGINLRLEAGYAGRSGVEVPLRYDGSAWTEVGLTTRALKPQRLDVGTPSTLAGTDGDQSVERDVRVGRNLLVAVLLRMLAWVGASHAGKWLRMAGDESGDVVLDDVEIEDVVGLQAALAATAASSHSHTISEVSDFPSEHTITVVTGVDFGAESVTTAEITYRGQAPV